MNRDDHFVNGSTLMKDSVVGFKNKIIGPRAYEGLHQFLRRTYRALRQGGELPVTHAEMDRTSRLIDALLSEGNRF